VVPHIQFKGPKIRRWHWQSSDMYVA